MPSFQFLAVLLIALSPAIGSFLAVLVDRLPRGEDVVKAPSQCRNCKGKLGAFDLIPIVSFILRRGRCGQCGAPIPPMVLYVELMAVGAAVLAVIAAQGDNVQLILSIMFLWLLIVLAVTDAIWFRLPDVLTAGLAITAFTWAILPGGNGVQALWGALIGAGSFWGIRLCYHRLRGREGLGLGDVKLMIGLGAFAGPLLVPWLVLLAASAALGVALIQRVMQGKFISSETPLPFGSALCGAGFAIWLAQALIAS
jgi:leader peptidase (prepilin peptidase)/N-methyltransferase